MTDQDARTIYRDTAADLYERTAGDWLSLERLWNKVVTSETTVGSRSGGWDVRKEATGDGVYPTNGDADVVVIYVTHNYKRREVGRWPFDEIAEYA